MLLSLSTRVPGIYQLTTQAPRAYCRTPGDIGIWIGKKGVDDCGFQSGDRVSTPRVGDCVNPTLIPLSTTICAKLATWPLPVKFPRHIPSAKPLHHRVY